MADSEDKERDKILEELKGLKVLINPVLALVHEFRDLKIKNKFSTESNISLLNLLSSNIKEEILKEMNALNQPIKESIWNLTDKVEENNSQVFRKFDFVQESLVEIDARTHEINESIGNMRGHLNKFYDKTDELRKGLEEKSSLEEVNDIRQRIKLFAFHSDLESLKADVFDKAPRNSVEKLKSRLSSIESSTNNFIDRSSIDDIKKQIQLEIEAYNDLNFTLKEEYMNFKDIYAANKQKTDDEFRGLIHKTESANKNLRESIAEVKLKLGNKPWKKDAERIDKELLNYCKITELKSLESKVFPLIHEFEELVQGFKGKIHQFEGVLMRYDEILLEKSSKDDIKFIKTQIAQLTPLEDFSANTFKTKQSIDSLEEMIESLRDELVSLVSYSQNLSGKFETIKKENKEVANVANLLNILKGDIADKADKIDFHEMMAQMGKKTDVEKLLETVDAIKKQMELGTILTHTLCRTLLSSGESSATLISQRQDIYRKMGNLINWLTGEEPRVKSTVPWKSSQPTKPELYLYKDDESYRNIPRSARNQTARIKIRTKRYTPKLEFASVDL